MLAQLLEIHIRMEIPASESSHLGAQVIAIVVLSAKATFAPAIRGTCPG